MNEVKHIAEYGTIWNKTDFENEKPVDSFDEVFLDERSFQSLKGFVTENNDIDPIFSFHRKKGRDLIRVKNHVGIVETRQGTVIEILPKIYRATEKTDGSEVSYAKSVLLEMLRTLRNSPFRCIDQAHLHTSKMPLIEIFITVFLDEMEKLVKRGIKHYYSTQSENQLFLKGKLQFNDNIKYNAAHRERFFVQFDEFKTDIPQNRILKAALVYLKSKSRSSKNINSINGYIHQFDDVSTCSNLNYDLIQINGHNRLFTHYDMALRWAKVFLLGQSLTSFKGKHLNAAILFPMEVLFESFVAHKLKQQHPEWNISVQDRKHYLATDLNYNAERRFHMRPDLVIETETKTIVADTKWKLIDENKPRENYQISQADMYQLFAYGKKYKVSKLFLIYPFSNHFTKQLSFDFENSNQDIPSMRLMCIPWSFEDIANNNSISLSSLPDLVSHFHSKSGI
jgi:5-methylcytosine-specific restriction enzyme subunit McrC